MSYDQKDGTGALFKNAKKLTEKHPDYTGNIMVNGESYWLSAWLKESRDGNKFMSLNAQKRDSKPADTPSKEYEHTSVPKKEDKSLKDPFDDFDSNIPF
jgi:hypothetical protein